MHKGNPVPLVYKTCLSGLFFSLVNYGIQQCTFLDKYLRIFMIVLHCVWVSACLRSRARVCNKKKVRIRVTIESFKWRINSCHSLVFLNLTAQFRRNRSSSVNLLVTYLICSTAIDNGKITLACLKSALLLRNKNAARSQWEPVLQSKVITLLHSLLENLHRRKTSLLELQS